MRVYLPPPKRYRRRSWRRKFPRLDRQVVPGHFQPPRTAAIPPRRLLAIVLLGIVLWVGVVGLALAVLA